MEFPRFDGGGLQPDDRLIGRKPGAPDTFVLQSIRKNQNEEGLCGVVFGYSSNAKSDCRVLLVYDIEKIHSKLSIILRDGALKNYLFFPKTKSSRPMREGIEFLSLPQNRY